MARINFTEEEDKIILDFISKYSENITEACEMAAKELGNRTPTAVSVRYYKYLRKKETNKVFFMFNRRRTLKNTKVVQRGRKSHKDLTQRSKWRRILAILAE